MKPLSNSLAISLDRPGHLRPCAGPAFLFPAFIIRPFAHQTSRGLLLGNGDPPARPDRLSCLRHRLSDPRRHPLAPSARSSQERHSPLVMVVVTASAVMSRLNYFEWMFHPVDSATIRNRIRQQARQGRDDPGGSLSAPMPAPIPSAKWPTTTSSTMSSGECPIAVTY